MAEPETSIEVLRQRLDSELPHLATKADLQVTRTEVQMVRTEVQVVRTEVQVVRTEVQEVKSSMRAWIIGTGISLFVALSGMQFAFFNILRSQ